jgi:hypothetical protein
VTFAAIADVKEGRRQAVKKIADTKYGTESCTMHRDFREVLDRKDIDAVLIATGPNWHGLMAMLAAKAGKDIYCEKPCTKNIAETLIHRDTMRRCGTVFQAGTQRRNLPHFAFACELARTGRLGKLKRVYAHPAGMKAAMSGWLPAETPPDPAAIDWEMYLGPAAWRPFNAKLLDGFNFEKGGGLVGGGVLEWGSHCVDLCQWAVNDCLPPTDYAPPVDDQIVCRYAGGTELVFREKDWIPLGSCPVRFEGETGWVEAGDSGKLVLSSPELLAGRKIEEIGGYPATFHVRDFLDCVKTRGKPKGNADAACNPYLAATLVLAAGLEGIREKIDPGPAQEDNLYEYTPEQLAAAGIEELPRTLDEAVKAFAADPFITKVLGQELRDEFITYKAEEWRQYHQTVSQWEVDRYARLF